jgi:hypothetical protein
MVGLFIGCFPPSKFAAAGQLYRLQTQDCFDYASHHRGMWFSRAALCARGFESSHMWLWGAARDPEAGLGVNAGGPTGIGNRMFGEKQTAIPDKSSPPRRIIR